MNKEKRITYIVATAVGGLMEQPGFIYNEYRKVVATDKEQAAKIYDKVMSSYYFYATTLGYIDYNGNHIILSDWVDEYAEINITQLMNPSIAIIDLNPDKLAQIGILPTESITDNMVRKVDVAGRDVYNDGLGPIDRLYKRMDDEIAEAKANYEKSVTKSNDVK